ncbi:TPA: energy coupling factor transporter S component ThiW, partial [Streptococcus agalactiae]|nr:energy coupling factor transporter S component ThiW [Streptococcus agalactiae]HEN8980933.1 energy coupling factor transporter S component ThiW [Streptococcus agalactiae]
GWFYRFYAKDWMSWVGEFIGTGIIGALLSAPIMVWFWTWTADGNHEVLAKASAAQSIFLFMPRFIGATIIGGVIALLLLQGLKRVPVFMTIQALFKGEKVK